MSPMLGQRSLDDLGIPLDEVTFCVLDVETTGGTAQTGALTEIGAVKLRAGTCVGTFQTLINPGMSIPREITVLTGISAATVVDAPPEHAVMPAFREFLGDTVIVGHNVRYDIGFLNAAAERCGFEPMQNRKVDTLALARRLIRSEVPNCKLSTLAAHLRLDHQPSHRALDDALATGDLLHLLLERAASWGVLGLDDLISLPKLASHPQAEKLRLTDDLPRSPGVYLFKDRSGRVLYVGKATNLRTRVRSYFSGDDRRKVGALLRETHHIDHLTCHHPLEAAVREIRLIHEHEPRFNRQGTTWRAAAYLRLTDEPFPRLSAVRQPPPPDSVFLGPLRSTSAARRVAEAVESVVKLRRCSARVPKALADEVRLDLDVQGTPLPAPCAPAQLGVATCPCSGQTSSAEYAEIVATTRAGLTNAPHLLIDPLKEKLQALSEQERFEDAAAIRDRASAIAEAHIRHRRLTMWRSAARVVLAMPDGSGAEIRHGLLHDAWGPDDEPPEPPPQPTPAPIGAVPREVVDELLCIASAFERAADQFRVVHVDGELACPLPRLERFTARAPSRRRR